MGWTGRAPAPNGAYRLLPRSYSLPQMAGGSASALSLSRPARASHALRPTGSLSRPRRPLSRGSSPASHPVEPLVSFQINQQFSGWNLPPLMIRAFRAHGQQKTLSPRSWFPDDRGRHLTEMFFQKIFALMAQLRPQLPLCAWRQTTVGGCGTH